MEHIGYVMPVVLLLAFGAYWFWMMKSRQQGMAGLGPAMHGFFQRSGFRYADMPPEPLERHVQRAMHEAQNWTPGDRVIHYVRDFRGLPIHHRSAYVSTDEGFSMSCSWSAMLMQAPRIPFHIADKSLSSLGKAFREAFSNTTRVWSPKHPQPVQTGIPQIDGRFVVFGQDPNAVRWMFQQNPALVSAILQCTEVDLWVDAREAFFADPMQKNMTAAMGGMVGQMAMGFDYAKRMDMSLPVHDRMSELLALAVRVSQ